jgi:hypothetical protein
MATPPKGFSKTKVDFNLDSDTYKAFAQMCTKKGVTPAMMVERYMKEAIAKG